MILLLSGYTTEIGIRVMYFLRSLIVFWSVLFSFPEQLLYILIQPMCWALNISFSFLSTEISALFLSTLNTSFLFVVIILPYVFLVQVWLFVAPCLLHYEQYWLWRIIVIILCLFYIGLYFLYFKISVSLLLFLSHFQERISIFIKSVPIQICPSIDSYYWSVFWVLRVYILLFGIGLLWLILSWGCFHSGRNTVIILRKTVYVLVLIGSALISPPDILSHFFLFMLGWMFYELWLFGMLIIYYYSKACTSDFKSVKLK